MDNDTVTTDIILKSLASLADKTGCREQLDAVEADNFEDYLKKALKVVGNRYAYFLVKAEEYISQSTGKVGINRSFKTWGKESPWIIFAVEGSEVTVTGSIHTLTDVNGKVVTWDKNNVYDYKPIVKPDAEIQEEITADPTNNLPF